MAELEPDEIAYRMGARAVAVEILAACVRRLGYTDKADPLWAVGTKILERERAIVQLRVLCKRHGDNDWPDQLDLGDIIDKHLARHLDGPTPPTPG